MRSFTSPYVIDAPRPISSARLETRMHLGAATAVELSVQNGVPAAGQATLSTSNAGPFCGSVARLRVATDCGCWSQLVKVPTCPPPSTPGSYDGDGGVIEPIPSCEPEDTVV